MRNNDAIADDVLPCPLCGRRGQETVDGRSPDREGKKYPPSPRALSERVALFAPIVIAIAAVVLIALAPGVFG